MNSQILIYGKISTIPTTYPVYEKVVTGFELLPMREIHRQGNLSAYFFTSVELTPSQIRNSSIGTKHSVLKNYRFKKFLRKMYGSAHPFL
jgi:hypothetical protein